MALTCISFSSQAKWIFNKSIPISHAIFNTYNYSTMVINPVTLGYAGDIHCMALNSLGQRINYLFMILLLGISYLMSQQLYKLFSFIQEQNNFL